MFLRKFFSALWSDLIASLSGGMSVVAAFAAAYFEFVAKNPKVFLWISSAICLVIAAYRVWAKEHQTLLDERAANGRARITGAIHKAFASPHREDKFVTVVVLEAHFSNQRPTPTTLRHFGISIAAGESTYNTDKIYKGTIEALYRGEKSGVVNNLGNYIATTPLEHGHHREGWLQFFLEGVRPEVVYNAPVTLLITDGFDEIHQIKGSRVTEPPKK